MNKEIKLIGGGKTAWNLYKIFRKNQLDSTVFYFKDNYGKGKTGFKPINKLDVNNLCENFIVTSEKAFVYYKKALEHKIPIHYFLRNKNNLHLISKKLNVNNIKEYDINNIEFPVFIKPKQSGEGLVPFKAKVINNLAELKENRDFIDFCSIQEYLDSNEYEQISIAGYFTGIAESLISVKQLNQYPLGVSSYVAFHLNPSIEKLKENISHYLNSLGFKGFVEFEFKKNKFDNYFYLMDINPRPWGWFYYYASAVENLKEVVLENDGPIIKIKSIWVNLPRLILSNFSGDFNNPSISRLFKKQICFEPYI